MNQNIQKVVGVAFLKNKKLLICQSKKSAKQQKFTFIGGGMEAGETVFEAAARECKEKIQNGFQITPADFELVLEFKEQVAFDPTKTIHMHIVLANKDIDVPLIPNEEILVFHWHQIQEDDQILSDSIKHHFIPYAVEKGFM